MTSAVVCLHLQRRNLAGRVGVQSAVEFSGNVDPSKYDVISGNFVCEQRRMCVCGVGRRSKSLTIFRCCISCSWKH